MDDLISRRAAIDALESKTYRHTYLDQIVGIIEDLPSAEPTEEEVIAFCERRCLKIISKEFYQLLAHGKYLPQPVVTPAIIRCKNCKHKPYPSDNYDRNNADCGFEIIFPDHRCPCRCDDEYYNYIPDDDWFCGNGERRTDG